MSSMRQGVAFRHGHQQRDGDRKDGRECEPLCLVRRIEHRRVADSRRAGGPDLLHRSERRQRRAPRRGACRREDDGNPRFVEYPERRQLPPADRHGEQAGAHLLVGDRPEAAVRHIPPERCGSQSRGNDRSARSLRLRSRYGLGRAQTQPEAELRRPADPDL